MLWRIQKFFNSFKKEFWLFHKGEMTRTLDLDQGREGNGFLDVLCSYKWDGIDISMKYCSKPAGEMISRSLAGCVPAFQNI